jgi:hypothetical protein
MNLENIGVKLSNMKDNIKKAVEEYQCSGCVVGHNVECYGNVSIIGQGCSKHCAGTRIAGVGKLFLGMPKPFMRLGENEGMIPYIFETFSEWGNYDKFNVPTWKYKDEHGNTLVRGMMPRKNETFIHVFLEDCLDKVNCYEITEEDIEFID